MEGQLRGRSGGGCSRELDEGGSWRFLVGLLRGDVGKEEGYSLLAHDFQMIEDRKLIVVVSLRLEVDLS